MVSYAPDTRVFPCAALQRVQGCKMTFSERSLFIYLRLINFLNDRSVAAKNLG